LKLQQLCGFQGFFLFKLLPIKTDEKGPL